MHWPVDEDAELALYVDFFGLARTPLGQSIVPFLEGSAQGSLGHDALQCAKDVMASVQEVVVQGGAHGSRALLTLVRFDEGAASPSTCLAASAAMATHLEGAPDAYRLGDTIVAHLPGLLVIGSEPKVAAALRQTSARPAPASLMLADDQYLVWKVNTPDDREIQGLTGRLALSAARFRLDVEGEVDEHTAAEMEAMLQSAKAATAIPGVGPQVMPMLKSLLAALSMRRDGKRVSAALDLEEPVADQLRDLSVTLYGVRKYIANAKTAEARNAVGWIAKDIAGSWEREEPGPAGNRKALGKKRLVSFAAVPKAVPRAMKYQSTPDDWKPWASIGFSMEEPQYFQYEVRAARDGQSAEILARGDLNGDGKTSLFRLEVAVDPKDHRTLMIAPSLEETDPEE